MRRKSSGAGREEAELRGGAGGGQRAARTWQLVQEQSNRGFGLRIVGGSGADWPYLYYVWRERVVPAGWLWTTR